MWEDYTFEAHRWAFRTFIGTDPLSLRSSPLLAANNPHVSKARALPLDDGDGQCGLWIRYERRDKERTEGPLAFFY